MKKYLVIPCILIISILAYAEEGKITIYDDNTVHPILNMEVVEIPAEGKVTEIIGDAGLKKNGMNEYTKIEIGSAIGEDDILWIEKDATIKILFDDGSYILNEPQDKDVFVTFELNHSIKLPK